jgi:hypothetical protein
MLNRFGSYPTNAGEPRIIVQVEKEIGSLFDGFQPHHQPRE